MKLLFIFAIALVFLSCSMVSAANYVAPTYNNVTIVLQPSYTAPTYSNVTIVLGILDYTLSSCGTISSAGVYTLNQSISGNTNCLIIANSNIEIDCAGYTITYGVTGAGTGISLSTDGYTNITIRNCKVKLTGNRASSSAISFAKENTNSAIINTTTNTTSVTSASSTRNMQLNQNSNNLRVENNTLYANSISNSINLGINTAGVIHNNTIIRGNVLMSGDGFQIGASTNGIIENNILYPTGSADIIGIEFTGTASYNNTLRNNSIYYGTASDGLGFCIGFSATSGPSTLAKIYNNYCEDRNTTRVAYAIKIQNTTIQNILIYNNTFNTTRYYSNASVRYNSWNSTLGNYYTNASGTGYSDTCSVTVTNYTCDVPYNLISVNNTDYIPWTWKTKSPNCWTRTNNIVMIPTGCLYNLNSGVAG